MAEKDYAQIAHDMNTLAAFEGVRDVASLNADELRRVVGAPQVDVLTLFGGAPLAGADAFACAMRAGVAKTYAIVGGVGHTTPAFRAKTRALRPEVEFADDASEAEVFDAYLRARHGLSADLLECESTNCGANVINLRALLAKRGVACGSMVYIHDVSMQRRMSAQIEKEMPGVLRVNYAAYQVCVELRDALATDGSTLSRLAFDREPLGMWDMGHYLTLLMGEVARLTDDENGYGPAGAGFIAHVDVPAEVTAAWTRLREVFPGSVRVAVPSSAS
ncbi:hypothetical protein [Paratractidigestivibacter sp.]|uniref:hypothetical protein n=1 Tax=Paratractidigestivibacter sp. TaxID=2847316 RepID=UPI002AC9B03E|nr:hypothetical protein [Paratractidigestivibacter sp.]